MVRLLAKLVQVGLTGITEAGVLVDDGAVAGNGQVLSGLVALDDGDLGSFLDAIGNGGGGWELYVIAQTPHAVNGGCEIAGGAARNNLTDASEEAQVLNGREAGEGVLFLQQSSGGGHGN